jgi:hypothetical protein
MKTTKRMILLGAVFLGAGVLAAPAAFAQGNTDLAHLQCAQGGGNGPVFGARGGADDGGISGLRNPNADHGAAGVLADNSNAGGSGEGGSSGGVGGSSLLGGGAGGCPGPSRPLLPVTGSATGRVAMIGLTFVLFGVPLLLLGHLRPWDPAPVRLASASAGERIRRRLRYLEIRERYRG